MGSNINGLEIITLRNYLLSKEELENFEQERDNDIGFKEDFKEKRLTRYKGEFVVYCQGYLCGHFEGNSGNRLLYTATQTYGSEKNISVYQIPSDENLETAVNNVLREDKKV